MQDESLHPRPQADACVYLTFDDGPDPEWTPPILDVLAAADMQATFFVIGSEARRHPYLIRRARAQGHEIANHTFDHRHPWAMSAREARSQVRDCATTLGDILGYPPRLYRPPHGRRRACMIEEAALCGETLVDWDLSAVDWGPFGASQRIAARLQRIRAGDIVLMHDGRNRRNRPDELLAVLPEFLDELRRRHLRSVSL
jgi:peptidoglycan/xylan/chitin deacetylase (PgdA/CDA1 family)